MEKWTHLTIHETHAIHGTSKQYKNKAVFKHVCILLGILIKLLPICYN